jgi:RHS repeat-associated protein
VLWDALAPTIGSLNLTIQAFQDQLQHLYKADATTLYYGVNPQGRVQVQSVITDAGAGVKKVTFPAMLGQPIFDVTEPNGGNTYGRRVDVVAATGEGLMTVTAYDRVGNSSAQTFLLYQDVLSPTVTLTVAGSFPNFEVAWAIEESGSGLAAYTVQVCTDSPTNCEDLISNPGTSGTYLYEGDPEHTYTFRVWAKDNVDNITTEESGASTAAVTKYYLFGGQRVAMRVGTGAQSAVYYLHGDHLGSTSLTTNTSGALVSQARYTPFGELNWEGGPDASPTDFGYTGQRNESGFGLMDYNARFYSASLGRFISPDSIIPGVGNPMAWDRFSYVQNNPLRFTDPSGHVCYDPGTDAVSSGNCNGGSSYKRNVTADTCRKQPWECSPNKPSSGPKLPQPQSSPPETTSSTLQCPIPFINCGASIVGPPGMSVTTNSAALIGGPGSPPAEETYTGFSTSGDSNTPIINAGNLVGLGTDVLVARRDGSGMVIKGSVYEVTGQVYYVMTPYGYAVTGVSITNTSVTDETISVVGVDVQTYYVSNGAPASYQVAYPYSYPAIVTLDYGSAIPGTSSSIVNVSVDVPNYLYAHVAISLISSVWNRTGTVGVTIYSNP